MTIDKQTVFFKKVFKIRNRNSSRKKNRRLKAVVDLVNISIDSSSIRHFTRNCWEQNTQRQILQTDTLKAELRKEKSENISVNFNNAVFVHWLFHSFSFYVSVVFMPYASSYCSDKTHINSFHHFMML